MLYLKCDKYNSNKQIRTGLRTPFKQANNSIINQATEINR